MLRMFVILCGLDIVFIVLCWIVSLVNFEGIIIEFLICMCVLMKFGIKYGLLVCCKGLMFKILFDV